MDSADLTDEEIRAAYSDASGGSYDAINVMAGYRMSVDTKLVCEVVDGELQIRIGVDILKFAAEHCERFYNGSVASADGPYIKVTDPEEFAREIVRLLNEETEDGHSIIHEMLDNVFVEAIEYGCEGVDHDFQQATTLQGD